MKHYKLLSIDLAKNVFQICCLDKNNQEKHNFKVKRNKLLEAVLQKNPQTIVMESCYSATHWGRTFQKHGFEVKLIPPQHVKPFVKGNKNDKHDALAIAEASMRPQGLYWTHTFMYTTMAKFLQRKSSLPTYFCFEKS